MAAFRGYQPAFTAGELSPALWARVDLAKFSTGLKTARNLFVHPHGGASNRTGTEFIREVKDSADAARIIPFQFNTEQTYIIEAGDLYFRFFRDGARVLEAATITGISKANPGVVLAAGHTFTNGEVVTISGVAGMTEVNGNTYTVAGAVAGVSFQLQGTNTTGFTTYTSGGTAAGVNVYELASPYAHGDLGLLTFIQEADVMYICHPLYAPRKLSRLGDAYWTISAVTFAPAIAAPAAPTAVATVGSGAVTYRYKVAAVADETAEESLPSALGSVTNNLATAGNKNTVSWTAVTGAARYIVYKEDNGVYGYIGGTTGLSFVDENITADLSDTPQTARNPFDAAGKYPRCAMFIEQRLAFASSINEPQAVWLSQSSNYENFGVSQPTKPNDAITFRIRAAQVNEIRSMIPLRGLMVLTSGAEWIVTGGSDSDVLTPSSVVVTNQGYRGAASVQPVVVGNTVLFAQNRGGVVRDFSYQFTEDSFVGKDLTILARHLFENKEIKAWAYQQAPYSIVWVVLTDGSLVSLTYIKEHEVWAWTHHKSGPDDDAIFEDVTTVAESNEDAVYFVVKRTVGGSSKRFIERLHTRVMATVEDAFFVDSGLTYTGSAATIITGLDHLNGQSVVALANGNVVRNLTVGAVTGGVGVTLPNSATKVHVGLPMEAALETLDLDLGMTQSGSVQGKKKSVPSVAIRVENTRGLWFGNTDFERGSPKSVEYKQRSGEAWNEAIGLYTGLIDQTLPWDWSDGGNMWIKQFDPLPMTVLALAPEIVIATG